MVELYAIIQKRIIQDKIHCEFVILYSDGSVHSYFSEHAHMLGMDDEESGTKPVIACSVGDARKHRTYRQG